MVEEKKKSSGYWWWGVLLALPVLYVLSVGPVRRIYRDSKDAGYDVKWMEATCVTLYAPLDWAYHENESVRNAFDSYFEVCGFD